MVNATTLPVEPQPSQEEVIAVLKQKLHDASLEDVSCVDSQVETQEEVQLSPEEQRKLDIKNEMNELAQQLADAKSTEERKLVATMYATRAKEIGLQDLKECQVDVIEDVKGGLADMSSPARRESALLCVMALCESFEQAIEPFVLPMLPMIIERHGDKHVAVQKAAKDAAAAFFQLPSEYATKLILPVFFDILKKVETKWQAKNACLECIGRMVVSAPKEIQSSMADIIPVVSDCMWDSKRDVKTAATETMTAVCSVVGNGDIEPFLPYLINCIADPTQVPDCVHRLAATTFVKTVDAPTLAIMVPLLVRALSEPSPVILRQTAVIIDNMCKLVEEPADAEQFLPLLLPKLDRVRDTAASPELRKVANKAYTTLSRVEESLQRDGRPLPPVAQEIVNAMVNDIVADKVEKMDAFVTTSLTHAAILIHRLIELKNYDSATWYEKCVLPYLSMYIPKGLHDIAADLSAKLLEISRQQAAAALSSQTTADTLCNCQFSLAYGGMILLNNTPFHLHKGHRYGLCGPNGVGKTTLMRAIANKQLEGFPSDVLKTVLVEHNLQGAESELSALQFVMEDERLKGVISEADARKALAEVGFSEKMQDMNVMSLSGGWKMKLELARATLVNADILLLDEPTNHLDVNNVAWLVNYLTTLKGVTCLIVSHDSTFLDLVCTDICHYENRKLRMYAGNLSEFVKVRPEAKSYYDMSQSQYTFSFPTPGILDGIKSKDKAILKMLNVSFTYPTSTEPTLKNITGLCSLSSRIGIVGPNGAGKSTLVKVLTGELNPTSGDVWKHPALRVAYVAQHAFHHLERHLTKTPNEYIRWRYQYGEDKELLEKESRQMSEKDAQALKQIIVHEGSKKQLESLLGRRKLKRTYEYEVKWVNIPHEENSWISRDQLEAWGFSKILQTYDDKEAARAGLYTRPLTAAVVEKHLEDVGLEAEFATHSMIKGLSGGQKVKVVLAAAMWNHPHLLVLDEPSNYLDRDSLNALAGAIKAFEGGVVIISHNASFREHLCPESWTLEGGCMTITGNIPANFEKINQSLVPDEQTDAFGNVTKVKQPNKKLSRKELKAKEKRKKEKLKNGEPLSSDEEDW